MQLACKSKREDAKRPITLSVVFGKVYMELHGYNMRSVKEAYSESDICVIHSDLKGEN